MVEEGFAQTDTSREYEDHEIDYMMQDCENKLEDLEDEGKLIK